jgi:hypothetical protein
VADRPDASMGQNDTLCGNIPEESSSRPSRKAGDGKVKLNVNKKRLASIRRAVAEIVVCCQFVFGQITAPIEDATASAGEEMNF